MEPRLKACIDNRKTFSSSNIFSTHPRILAIGWTSAH